MNSFEKIVTNIGVQLKLPKEDIEGIKLSAMGGSSKRDYLAFDCAMKDKGEVRYFFWSERSACAALGCRQKRSWPL